MSTSRILEEYDIQVHRLANGKHIYQMPVNDKFFESFDYGLVNKGKAEAQVILVKTSNMMTVLVAINGQVELVCDRSLEPFWYPVSVSETLYIKYGEEEAELDDDLLVILPTTQKVNLAQFIYEIIGASLPMKRIHPDFKNELDDEDDESEGSMVYSTFSEEDDEPASKDKKEDPSEENSDPRWEALKKIRNN